MNAEQLISLINHIKEHFKVFPPLDETFDKGDEVLKEASDGTMEPWEVDMKQRIDGDSSLPDYEKMEDDVAYDFVFWYLFDYYLDASAGSKPG